MRIHIMLIAIFVVLGMFLGGGATVLGDDRIVGSSFTISGVGIMDTSYEINTDKDYSGLALSTYLYTPSLGMNGPSYMEHTNKVKLDIYNISEVNQAQRIVYSEDGMTSNVRHSVYIKNYEVGSVAGFTYIGNVTEHVNVYADSGLSVIDMEGAIEGKMTLRQLTKDPVTRIMVAREVNEFTGNFAYEWNVYAGLIGHPAPENDWLGCP